MEICGARRLGDGRKNEIKCTYGTRGGEIARERFPVAIEIERREWGETDETDKQ